MDICIIVTYDLVEPGGVRNHAFDLAESLRRRGDRVHIIGPTTEPIDDPHVTGFPGIVNIRSNGGNNAVGVLNRPWQIWRFLQQHRFDVIHIHEPLNPMLPYYATWATPRTAHVATFHAFYPHETRAMLLARRVFSATLFPFVQRGIAVSAPAAAFARVTFKRPLTVIPNGVSLRTFRPGAPPGPSVKRPLRLLSTGRPSDEQKGFRHLIDAFRLLQARGVDVALDVFGNRDGDVPSEWRLPGITYHGTVSLAALAPWYAACDVFVAPAEGKESFGMVLIEAMASARPIVCSDIEGYRDVADRVGARLVPPCDGAALAAAIAELAADPATRRQMGAWNLERAAAFDWDQVALRVREQYRMAIAEVAGMPYRAEEKEAPGAAVSSSHESSRRQRSPRRGR